MKPQVTVLMSVYNGERFLAEALESILTQTWTDFEFLIINDASTDRSREIILSYEDDRIRLVDNKSNLGLTRSLNKGLGLAQGVLIARQDADDVSHPTRLAKQVAFLEAHPEVALLGTAARSINEQGRPIKVAGWLQSQQDQAIHWQLMFDSPFVHTSVMFRREVVWERLQGYDNNFRTSQDYELWSRVAAEFAVRNLQEALLDLRGSTPKSVSANYNVEDLQRVETILRANLCRYLCLEEPPPGWLDFWVSINNPRTIGKIVNVDVGLAALEGFYPRFVELNPGAESDKEIRRHLAAIFIRIAGYLAPHNRGGAIRSYIKAARVDPGLARQGALKFIGLFLFGNVICPLRNFW